MPAPAPNLLEYSVSEISNAVKRAVEDGFSYVRVRGEISGFRGPHSSGHCYFSLKDDRARLEAVVWRSTVPRLRFRPEEGIEVVATGRLTTFPGQSKYQIVIDALEPAGVGALMALLEERRKKLGTEGLFDAARKKPLPYLPQVIGIITSPTGAVIRDILHRLGDRFPVRVLVWPVTVQGETAAGEVATAIRGFNAPARDSGWPRPDVLIVARGGGSLEDLWAFNEEMVVRAAAASAIPLIAAVGHETDTTLIDHVADRRAPTPSAAAEMAVPVRTELVADLRALAARHSGAMGRIAETRRRNLAAALRALPKPDDIVASPRRSIDDLGVRLGQGLSANARAHRLHFERSAARLSVARLEALLRQASDRLQSLAQRRDTMVSGLNRQRRLALTAQADRLRPEPITNQINRDHQHLAAVATSLARAQTVFAAQRKRDLAALGTLLRSVSYRNTLARGFALVRTDKRPIHSASQVTSGDGLEIQFHDGNVSAVATSGKPRRKVAKPPPGDDQGRLL
ncbi:exodeoxyribonuclease VII large subunit [Bauldia sp.]|uniref:exodeoxyribonuclease VII large subunit n=1 Tax=Bauldia sp. TaxID=2575872 RepID=UPI003BABA878